VRAPHIGILFCLATPLLLYSQSADPDVPPEIEAIHPPSPISDDRIFGVIPNFQTVSDPTKPYVPLRVRDKFTLFVK
jgi:hypothetical protein